ncbi:MAG: hypothetical protein RLP14_09315 [Owenweeksia sp.]
MIKSLRIFVAMAVMSMSIVSCNKSEDATVPPSDGDKKLCVWCAAAAYALVGIVEALAEGQYTEVSNGDVTIKDCSGIGSCAISGRIDDGSSFDGDEVSSSPAEHWDYHEHNLPGAAIVKMNSGEIIFTFKPDADPQDVNTFFYGPDIFVSRPWVIDHPYVLETLDEDNPIVLNEGYHQVQYDVDGTKYIVLQ